MNEWMTRVATKIMHSLLHVHIFGAFRVFEVTADSRKEEYRKPEKEKKGKVQKLRGEKHD